MIAFLSVDDKELIQIFGVSPEGGNVSQLTVNPFSVQSSFNISPDDRNVAFVADNRIYITNLLNSETRILTGRFSDSEVPVGAPVWSNDGQLLAYNRYVENKGGRFLHIFLLKVCI
jgi:Tol biopolymer transport system component